MNMKYSIVGFSITAMILGTGAFSRELMTNNNTIEYIADKDTRKKLVIRVVK